MAEELKVMMAVKDPTERNELRERKGIEPTDLWSMSFWWERNGHPVGAFVEYHKDHETAWEVLAGHMWKAMQDPDAYDITSGTYDNDVPVAVLDR